MTGVPFAPEPRVAANGSLAVVHHASWVFAIDTSGAGVASAQLDFEPGATAVSADGDLVVAAGESTIALLDVADSAMTLRWAHQIPIDEPVQLDVTADGVVYALGDDGALVRVDDDGPGDPIDATGDAADGMVALDDRVVLLWGDDAEVAVTLVDFSESNAQLIETGIDSPRTVQVTTTRVVMHRGDTTLTYTAQGPELELECEVETPEAERVIAAPSGLQLLVASVHWDGETDHLHLETVDVSADGDVSPDRMTVDMTLGPDVQLALGNDGIVTAAWGDIRPQRVLIRTGAAAPSGDDHGDVTIDLDHLLDDLLADETLRDD